MRPLTMVELERGWVEYKCADHGFLVAGTPTLIVKCACGKPAYAYRDGQRLRKRDIKPLQLAHNFSVIDAVTARKGRGRGQPFPNRKAA